MDTSVVTGLIETVFNQGQVDRWPEFVADDVVDHNQIIFGQPDGPDGGVAEGVRMFLRAFPDFRAEVAETVAQDGRVAARLVMHGTNTGEYRGLPAATGRHAVWEAVAIFHVTRGKACSQRLRCRYE